MKRIKRIIATSLLTLVLLVTAVNVASAASARVWVSNTSLATGRSVKLTQSNGAVRWQQVKYNYPTWGSLGTTFYSVPTGWTRAEFWYANGVYRNQWYYINYSWQSYKFYLWY